MHEVTSVSVIFHDYMTDHMDKLLKFKVSTVERHKKVFLTFRQKNFICQSPQKYHQYENVLNILRKAHVVSISFNIKVKKSVLNINSKGYGNTFKLES